jgi:hypothetical protein
MLYNVVELALKGKLPTTDYPVIASDFPYSQTTTTTPASNVIIFIVGGATFEEAKEMAQSFNATGVRVIVGGNIVHNSKTFMADISQIQIQKGQQMP